MATSSRIANYQPEELLASAGAVDTFRARSKGREDLVALKVFFLERAGGDAGKAAAQRFLTAGRRMLGSPLSGTARVLDVSDDLEAAFIASEFVTGMDLAALLAALARKRSRLDPVVAGLLCADVAETLVVAHAAKSPRFHLGLCLGNVVVTRAANALVLDFGLTAALRSCMPVPAEKWLFTAPELVGADVASLPDYAAVAGDLYSVGALLHVLLGGMLPSAVSNLAELRRRKSGALADLSGVPKHLQSAVRALTAPSPEERPDSARTVVEWLSNGIASGKERQLYVAAALEPFGINAVGSDGATTAAAAGRFAARPTVFAAAPARRRPRWTWLGLALFGAAVAAFFSWRHSTRPPLLSRNADRVATATQRTPSLQLGQAEVLVMYTHDGGVHIAQQPADRVYVPGPKQKLPRVPGHLFLATTPDQADVWVDGALKGKTPVDLVVGPGGHRVVAIKRGYRMLRAVYDTTDGEYVRKDLQRAAVPTVGDAFLDVDCREPGNFPLFIDDEETGLLCPAPRVPVASGKHNVGIYVPAKRAVVAVEVTAVAGTQSTRVVLDQ